MNDKKQNKMPKYGARYVAARGLQNVLEKQLPLDQALAGQALFEQLETRDRGFARQLDGDHLLIVMPYALRDLLKNRSDEKSK